MKKKILLVALMAVLIVCAFAISVSAYDLNRTVELDNKTVVELYDTEGNALTWYMDGTTLKSIKTADIISISQETSEDKNSYATFRFNSTVAASNMVVVNFQDEKLGDLQVFGTNFQGSTSLEYCYMPKTLERLSKNYDSANVFRETTKCKIVDFPVDCELNFIGKYSFSKATALKEIHIPAKVTAIPEGYGGWDWGCFLNCTSLTKVTFGSNTLIKSIPNGTFSGCTSLTEIVIPDSVETVGVYAFKSAGIIDSPFSVNSKCTYINKWAFAFCASLKNINIPKNATFNTTEKTEGYGLFHQCTSLVEVNFHPDSIDTLYPAHMFTGCSALKEVKLPNSLTQLPCRLFNNCSSLETLYLGANVVGLNNLRTSSTDHNSLTYGCDKLKYVYLPKTLNIDAETHSNACHVFGAGGNVTFYFDGTEAQAIALQNAFKNNVTSCGNNGKITGATIISLEEYNKLSEITKCYLVFGGNTCEMFYNGNHVENDTVNGNACYLADCKNCDFEGKYIGDDDTHNLNHEYTYANGYMAAGQIVSVCQNSGCKHGTESTAITSPLDALFNSLEYSVAEEGFGICVKYNVNKDALAVYKNSGKSISFGVVAIMADKVQGNGPLANNGKLTTEKNVVAADVTADNLRAVTLRIAGDENAWKDNASRAIYVLGYATNGTDLEYLGTASGAQVDRNNITSVKSLVIGNFFNFNA